jgi:hypothetical protein
MYQRQCLHKYYLGFAVWITPGACDDLTMEMIEDDKFDQTMHASVIRSVVEEHKLVIERIEIHPAHILFIQKWETNRPALVWCREKLDVVPS